MRFPDLDIPRVKKRDFAYLIAEIKKRRKYMELLSAVEKTVTDTRSYEDVDAAITTLSKSLRDLSYSNGQKDHIVDIFSKKAQMRMVKELRNIRKGSAGGIPTGLETFDKTAGGLHRNRMVVVIGRTSIGKAQPLDANILTPQGWRAMGDIEVGDKVVSADGVPTRVVAVHPQGVQDIYKVTFGDRTSCEVTADHLWYTTTCLERRRKASGQVRTTAEIATSLRHRNARWNHHIPLIEPPEWPDNNQPLPPYLLGLLLGDGHSRRSELSISTADDEILQAVRKMIPPGYKLSQAKSNQYDWHIVKDAPRNTYVPNEVSEAWKSLGLRDTRSANKFVPYSYKFASSEVRLAVLQGLMDTDGEVSKDGAENFNTTSPQLRDDFIWLVQSLGGTASSVERVSQVGTTNWRIYLRLPSHLCPVRLTRKIALRRKRKWDEPTRAIRSVEKVRRAPAQCITIEHHSQLYVTDNCIVTHNSWLDLLFVANAVAGGHKVLLFPLEMTLEETAFRLYTIFSRMVLGADKVIKNYDLASGHVTSKKLLGFFDALQKKYSGELLVADIGALRDPYTNERIDAEVEAHKPDMFWVDYLTLLKGPSLKDAKGYEAVSELSRGIKGTAMRTNSVGGCSAQVNREALKANVFLPRLEHIAYGDSIGQDANQVFSINRMNQYMYYSLVKNRHGPEIEKIKMRFDVDVGLLKEIPDVDHDDKEQ